MTSGDSSSAVRLLSALSKRARPVAALAAVPLLGSCNGLEFPESPDLEAIAAIYDEPTGSVGDANIAEAVAVFLVRADAVLSLGRLDFVVDSLTSVADSVKDVAAESEDSIFQIRGVTNVVTYCSGHATEPERMPENGSLEYVLTFEQNAISDTVWGDFIDCRFLDPEIENPLDDDQNLGRALMVNSSLDIYLGGPIPLKTLDFDKFLFRMDGTLRGEADDAGGGAGQAAELDLGFDFRLDTALRTEIRVPGIDGDLVFAVGTDSFVVELRARDIAYCCDLPASTCTELASGSCDEPTLGDRVLRW